MPTPRTFRQCGGRIWTSAVLLVGLTMSTAPARDLPNQELLNRRLTLDLNERALRTVLNVIEKKADVRFMYSPRLIEPNRRLSVRASDERLSAILDRTLTPLRIQYELVGKQIVLNKTPGALNAVASLQLVPLEISQERQLSGTVTDEENQPVVGASLVVKGSTRGATTDGEGRYRLALPEGDVTLVVSSVGYQRQEIQVGTRSLLDIRMQVSQESLDEVIVVGYGTQKRASVTAAVSSVNAKEISALPVVSAESALQGRVPGVSVVNNGAPGEAPIVRIRGIGSINYGSGPLYVVDGVPTGDLNNFDPKDIESIEVLKDASSAAIYGSRAANGVILVTTKKGKSGKLRVDLDGYYGVQSAWKRLDLLNRDQYVQYATALLGNATPPIPLPPRLQNLNQPIYPGATQTFAQTETDWQDAIFQDAPIMQYQLSVSGGNGPSKLYTSASYFKQDGIMLGTGYQRGSVRLNSDHQIGKRLSFGQTLMISYDEQKGEQNIGGRSQLMHTIRMQPYFPVTNPTLLGGYGAPTAADGSDPENPVRAAIQDRVRNERMKVLGTMYFDVKLFDFLRYRLQVAGDYVSGINRAFLPIYNDGYKSRPTAELRDNRFTNFSPTYTNILTFDKTFGKHSLNAVAVYERQSGTFSGLNSRGFRPDNAIDQLQGISNFGVDGNRSQNVLMSYVGRVSYEYAGKYLLNASIRRDGSSRFAPGNKWGNFPSASAGWRVSAEPFMQDVTAVSELKLRASYGKTGFNGIGDYAWQALVQADNTAYVFGTTRVTGSYFNELGNTELKWETTDMWNAGFDLGLFQNRFTVSGEVYNRFTDGLILRVPIPNSLGYSSAPLQNIGSMRNWGYELEAGYNRSEGAFRWNLSANLGINRNRVESLATPNAAIFSGNNSDYGGFDITKTEAGQPIQTFYGWVVDGIFQNAGEVRAANTLDGNEATPYQNAATAPGDIRFRDISGPNGVPDGRITADDRAYLGSYIPKFNYGINFSANFQNFDLTVFVQGVQGNKIYNGTKVLTQGMLRLFNAGTEVLDAWTPQNTNTDVPRAVSGDPNNNSRTSDRFIEDGSYLRVKNLSFGYTLPASALQSWSKGAVSRVRIYVNTQNLLTLTRYTGYDPEVGSRFGSLLTNGIDYGQFPQARSVMLGVQLGF